MFCFIVWKEIFERIVDNIKCFTVIAFTLVYCSLQKITENK